MPYLKQPARRMRSADTISAINRVLERYVDFTDLHWRVGEETRKVECLGHPDDTTLVIRFGEAIESERVTLFTVVNGRYLEFDLDVVSPAEDGPAPDAYLTRIRKCEIALDRREHDRIYFRETLPQATGITTVKVRETPADFLRSVSVRIIVEETVAKLKAGDVQRAVFSDDRDMPPPARLVIKTGEGLHVSDMSNPSELHSQLFAKAEDLVAATIEWMKAHATNNRAIIVRPLTYLPLLGDPFSFGCLMVFKKQADFAPDEIERLDAFPEELSERIRNGNLADRSATGVIHDVSAGGAKLGLSDAAVIDKLLSQNVVMVTMQFREDHPLLVSGTVVYVYRRDDGGYYVGIDYRGSRFGPRIANVLAGHVRHFLYRPKA